jgi:hypothetical protein
VIQEYLPYLGIRRGYRYIYHTLGSCRDTGIFTIPWDHAGIQVYLPYLGIRQGYRYVHISTSLSINVCKVAIYRIRQG